jgi:hypothetical protein
MRLSVVVTIVDGGAALARCLGALVTQKGAPPMEVLVPFDDSFPAEPFTARFVGFTFLALGAIRTVHPITSALGQHELFDRRRAAGLAAARGELVAILEDRGVPHEDWAAAFSRLHEQHADAVIGGAIESGSDRVLNRAVFFCDFGRFQRPFRPAQSRVASDVNVCYKRAALQSVKSSWNGRYHEPIVHNRLLRAGETIFLSPEPVVEQIRDHLRLGAVCKERLAWGRLYAEIRRRWLNWPARLVLIAASPLLPAVILFRILRERVTRRTALSEVLAAVPCVLLLVCCWSVGEGLGYLLSRGGRATPV